MRFVYGIAFLDDKFVMVFNPKRGGWEMPGGRVEEGETTLQAMEREFIEESGHRFIAHGSRGEGEGTIFAGRMGEHVGKGEMDWRAFDRLPPELAFPQVEYLQLIEWARDQLVRPGQNGM